jgi:tRNA(His) 5'-end guanylyltransferase
MSDTKNDELGNRMKSYEGVEAMRKLSSEQPVVVRLDGRGFSKFTKGMVRPFDKHFHALMQETTEYLMGLTGAVLGYTQSDEITLVMLTKEGQEPLFGNRVSKLCSTLAATASVFLNSRLGLRFPGKVHLLPTLDCRAWNVPSLTEAANTVLWRYLDCKKNAVSMAAHSVFSHNSLQGLVTREMIEKLKNEKDIDFHSFYPHQFRHGSFFTRKTLLIPFSKEELESLPEKHEARRNPSLLVERSRILLQETPGLDKISNLAAFLFENAPPEYRQ